MQKTFYDPFLSRMSMGIASSRRIVWFIVFSGIFMASVVIHPFHEGEFTVCIVKNVFGIPCPGCGMTRAFLFIGHGDISTALRLNINSLWVFSIIVVLWMHAVFTVITGKKIRVHLTRLENIVIYILAGAATTLGWIYNIFLNPWV